MSPGVVFSIILTIVGVTAGLVAAVWAGWMLAGYVNVGVVRCHACGAGLSPFRWSPFRRCPACNGRDRGWPSCATVATGGLFLAIGWLIAPEGIACQTVNEVRPAFSEWGGLRLPFHLVLVFLLVTATITDLLDYVIPDAITLTGLVIAILAATAVGDLQTIHVWVDHDPLNPAKPVAIYGPYLPDWLQQHQHLHGFVWSIAGALAGAAPVWLARFASHRILGQPAIGLGDVTLMAMIGAFLGWQPTLCALMLAPLCALVIGGGIRLLTGRTFMAFGPYLAAGAIIVLCTWRFLWVNAELRMTFSHWPTLAVTAAASFAVFCLLLVVVRLFRAIPPERLRR